MEETPPESPKFNMPQVERPEEEKVPDAPLPSELKEFKPRKSKKKLLLIALLLIALGAAAVWYFVLRDKEGGQTQPQAAQQQTESNELITLGEADTLPYAFMAGDAAFYSVFLRNVSGGDRTEIGPLAAQSFISHSATSGQNVAYVVENMEGGTGETAVWLSRDAGKNYEQLLELSPGDQVTSMVFSTDGSALAVAVLKKDADRNSVSFIDLESKDETDSFSSEQPGVFLEGYHAKKASVIYYEGCYNCDVNVASKLQSRNLSDDSVKVVADAGDADFALTEVRSDFSEILVSKSAGQGADDGSGLGSNPPYTIQTVQLNDGEKKDIGSVSDAEVVGLGYLADGKTPYYAYSNLVVSPNEDGATQTLFESDSPILKVLYVSKDRVIASTGTEVDFLLRNYDIAASSEAVVLNGDGNTVIFGVTTK